MPNDEPRNFLSVIPKQASIIDTELFDHCKKGNFNIHIWAWFGNFICGQFHQRVYDVLLS